MLTRRTSRLTLAALAGLGLVFAALASTAVTSLAMATTSSARDHATVTQDGDSDEATEAEKTPEADPTRPMPKLDDPEQKSAFEQAVALFDRDEWKDAEKAFKSLERDVPSEQRDVVKLWRFAADGGPKLEPVEKSVAKARWKEAWFKLARVTARYGETPLRKKIESYEETISKQIFLDLATYEADPPKAQKELDQRTQGAELNTKLEFVKRGKRSLAWTPRAMGPGGFGMAYLPIADVEGSQIDEYRYLHISIYSPNDVPSKFALFFSTGQAINNNPFQTRAFFKHIMLDKKGWYDLRVDLWKDLSSYSSPERADIQEFALMLVPPTQSKTIYIDEVKLEKK